jgi:hypothetical protein
VTGDFNLRFWTLLAKAALATIKPTVSASPLQTLSCTRGGSSFLEAGDSTASNLEALLTATCSTSVAK